MTTKEIRELLVLKEWTRKDLAEQLGLAANTVAKWFIVPEDQRRHPSPERVEQMRQWLDEARDEARAANPQKAVAHAG